MQDSRKDFFISYTSTDHTWAEWIAWHLEDAGYSTVFQEWDIRPGSNVVLEMDKAAIEADRFVAVLSPDYLSTPFTKAEWATAFRRDPTGEQGTLLPVHVRECKHQLAGFLGSINYIDLVGLDDERTASQRLLAGIRSERTKPTTRPSVPEGVQHSLAEQPRFPGAFPRLWNVPFQRNPFFTGREDVLKHLYDTLKMDKTVAVVQPRALTGLGGIGKTQTAVEYLYRYYSDYPQAILWTNADSRETLVSYFLTIADLLNLSEKNEQDQNRAIEAVKRWFKDHSGWLLILDNVEDLEKIKDFIPSARRGHILLTTRIQAVGGTARSIEIEKMGPDEGALFLLRRANMIGSDATLEDASEKSYAKAKEISQELEGLPLALDQTGAYIDETGCSLSDYLDLYRTQRAALLKERGNPGFDHPESVSTTFSLSFKKVQKANSSAIELLWLCAFLSPDVIPEEIIINGAPDLGPVLQSVAADPFKLNAAIKELRKFSLLYRYPDDKTFSIHRLVQAVLKDTMDETMRHQWAERTVRAVNDAFPDVNFDTWQGCQRCLPHAQACAKLIEQWDMLFPEAAFLLNQTGAYLEERALYTEAEQFLRHALAIHERVLGPVHSNTAISLNNLANLLYEQDKYQEAEPLYRRALAIREQHLGPEHPDTATSLDTLAGLYYAQGKPQEAEPLFRRALAIREQHLGPEHPDTATSLNNLAQFLEAQGKPQEAEPLFRRALAIREQHLGSGHPDTATSLDTLANYFNAQGNLQEAEPLYRRALAIREQHLGPEHPDTATSLNNLANLLEVQGRYREAEPFYQRALTILERQWGSEHRDIATSLHNLAYLYYAQGNLQEAEPLYRRALAIREQHLGSEHPSTATSLGNLANLLYAQSKYQEAEPLFRRFLAFLEQQWGPGHPNTTLSLDNLANTLEAQGKFQEAELLFRRALEIREQTWGLTHPRTNSARKNYFDLLKKMKRKKRS